MKKIRTISTASLLILTVSACISTPRVEEPVTEEPVVEEGKEFGNQLGAVRYVIQPGDNLFLIASEQTRASDNWRRIADFNRIQNPASIKVGQTIWIPNDLIPLSSTENNTREIAGHPDAVVKSVELPTRINPVRP